MAAAKLEIEISTGAKDLEVLKGKDLTIIEELSLILFKPLSLKFLKDFTHLKKLMISGTVKDYSPLAGCDTLEILHLSGGTIDELDFIRTLSIHTLILEASKSRVDTLVIPNLTSLENIRISEVGSMADLSFLSDFSSLKSIALFHLKSEQLFEGSALHQLERLYLTNMFNLKDLSRLKSFPSLQLLYIHQFFVNRKVKIDAKAALFKIAPELKNIDTIRLKINEEEYVNTSGEWVSHTDK
ncbi:hypothetical protein [Chitinophaga arvensicola]|uniref:Leucine rich repeat-containing protein n=1 Tax=Chitinophaga arvensicola TaxID=29529 RepID=A0A1I0S9K2_9BACT|nr:hypothetical protein [Chitinophaga arvensicola]SEW52769.1 hypothetical protein SAMN04488122_5101 [Chitinophaga arvensicola]